MLATVRVHAYDQLNVQMLLVNPTTAARQLLTDDLRTISRQTQIAQKQMQKPDRKASLLSELKRNRCDGGTAAETLGFCFSKLSILTLHLTCPRLSRFMCS
jgi:hypothetical protein